MDGLPRTALDLAVTLLRHPVILAELLAVVLVLYGAGRAVGAPLLFWHECAGPQFLAGVGSTLLGGQLVLVAYLLEAEGSRSPLSSQLLVAAALWLAIVGVRAVQMQLRKRSRSSLGVTPTIAPGSAPRSRASMHVSPLPFVAGALLAVAVVAAGVRFGRGSTPPAFVVPLLTWANEVRPLPDAQLHLTAAVVYALVGVAFVALRTVATPALGVAILLALVGGGYGFLSFWFHNAGVALLVLALALWWGGWPRYKLRIQALALLYDRPVPYLVGPSATVPVGESTFVDALASGAAPAWPDGAQRRPLVVVCTSGGGIRAAAWTAAILERLDAHPGFRQSARLIAGASGGMVGAAFWVAHLAGTRAAGCAAHQDKPLSLYEAVTSDSLTPVARRLVFNDVPLAFLGAVNRRDRGAALEASWKRALCPKCGFDLGVPLAALAAGENRGAWPTLVFSPMLLEDGRRLIMSNARLRTVLANDVTWLSSKTNPEPHPGRASTSAVHFADQFPDAVATFPLSTAARLSAAFPYISPAVTLPTVPRRRVVDAGYYDNYGLDLACGWLRDSLDANSRWIRDHVSGVLLIQVRDGTSDISLNADPAPGSPEKNSGALGRGLEGLTSPPTGLVRGRESVMVFRNDGQLETVQRGYDQAFGQNFFVTTLFELRGGVSLSWYLGEVEKAHILGQADSDGIRGKLDRVGAWLGARGV